MSVTQEWMETLRLQPEIVNKAITEANQPDPPAVDIICALITHDNISPAMGAALQAAAKIGEKRLNELALAIFRAGVTMGINMTRIAIEEQAHD